MPSPVRQPLAAQNPKDEVTVELEQRVKLLEQEVKLLKNEVQATLLDIQEQLLSNRYPGLRAEASQLPEMSAAAPNTSSDEKPLAKPTPPAPLKRVRSVDLDSPQPRTNSHSATSSNGSQSARPAPLTPFKLVPSVDPASPKPPSKARPAASNSGGQTSKMAPPPAPKSVPSAGPAPTMLSEKAKREVQAKVDEAIDWEALSQQTEWTLRVVRQHGSEYTRQLIDVYTRQGLLSEKVGAVLTHTAAIFQAEYQPAEKEPDKKPANGTMPSKAPDKALRSVIVRIIHHLQSLGAVKEAPRG